MRTCLRPLLIYGVALAGLATWPSSLSADPAEGAAYRLRYQFEPGQTMHYSIVNTSHLDVTYGVNKDVVIHSSVSAKHFRVVRFSEEGHTVLQLMIDRAYMRAVQGGHTTVFDSSSRDAPPEAFVGVAATVGQPWVHVTVSPRGEVLLVEPLIPGAPGIDVETEVQNNVLALLPEDDIHIGETWQEDFDVSVRIDTTSQLKRNIRMRRIYTLRSVEQGQATIDLRTIILSPVRDPFQEGQLVQRTPTGTLVFDLERGRLVSRELKVTGQAVGFSGAQSSLTVESHRVEAILPREEIPGFFVRQIALQEELQPRSSAP